ncbi:MAG: L-threonylcarbamoyladenylate synthase [Zoogloea sp.]|uniref:L-threonylcarbamoyladenylate synthase n=1 Tax=Zoogloea sp. TaxID=49181 RepID=UPI002629BD0B|nr:L-threonylcarbamoyladenylate synthase [Zoogloea sp.]MDD3327152.1 L-threonylcarbamoyladenylate synthase [Zoogloea sp.]
MNDIQRAVQLLRQGELVALPTETVYGLGADALNPDAVARIFTAKGRPSDHPLIVHLADAGQIMTWAREVPKDAIALARAFWPGPLTLILKKDESVPDLVTGGQDTVGLRVPDHPVALDLLRAFGSGVAAPSANRFGRISPTTAAHVRQELGSRVALILDGGACKVGLESTIVDLSRGVPVILRPGAIGADEIARVLGRRPRLRAETEAGNTAEEGATPRVSGALAAHYAPRTPLELVATDALAAQARPGDAVLARCAAPASLAEGVAWAQAPADPAGYGHDLYAQLRRLDESGAARILVEAPPATPDWAAVADRLGRAAVGSGEDDET